ncbi:S-layer homology domain-containing protein [Thermoanaerobacterium thermosaccharolyticum]|uniref:Putative S-layer protein n=1 Tax=Thermoanaerobacterium thermosaccharolyticum M0795 TaxID=698948 RepID=L0IQB2_THETR|nr:S-layer homology domain-containing protein [Thermoanaerobacterium thermosaccharolyticum]AGB20187.1 putative S-layer protein [Thermoanaerobacterium thermosaccharolyticum M0795]
MKNLKKLIAVVLTFTLVFSAMAVGFAGTFSDVSSSAPYASAVDRLQSLGLVSGMPDGTFQPDGVVTRAQMIAFVNAAEGLQQAAKVSAGPTKFSDVPANFWAAGDINVADPSGYPDGTFRPNNPVTYTEALAMILRALGYTQDYSWPYGVISKATSVGITKGVVLSAGTTITRGEMAMLINNALDLDINTYVNGAESDTGKTLLSRVGNSTTYYVYATHDVDSNVTAGYVKVVPVTETNGLYQMTKDNSGNLVYTLIPTGSVNFNNYLGQIVTVNEDTNGNPLAATPVTTDIKTFTATTNSEVTQNTNGTYSFYDASVSVGNIPVVVDGVLTTMADVYKSQVVDNGSKITLIDPTNVSGYGYAVITDATGNAQSLLVNNDVTSSDSYIDNRFAINDGSGNPYPVVGAVSKATDIKAGDVVYQVSIPVDNQDVTNGTATVLYVVRQSVTGTISQVSVSGSTTTVTINGTNYTVGSAIPGSTGISVSAGSTGTAIVGKNNTIVQWSGTSTATNYAVVQYGNTFTPYNTSVSLALPDGTSKVFNVVYSDVPGSVVSSVNAGDVVTYSLDSNGNISNLAEVTVNSVSSAGVTTDKTNNLIKINGTPYYVNSSTVFYNYDTTDKTLTPVNWSDVADSSNPAIYAYSLSSSSYRTLSLVIFNNVSSLTSTTTPVVYVTGINEVATSSTSYISLNVIENGVSKTYNAPAGTLNLGDIAVNSNGAVTAGSTNTAYQLTVNASGNVIGATLLETADASTGYAEGTTVSFNYSNNSIVVYGGGQYALDNNLVVINAVNGANTVVGLGSIVQDTVTKDSNGNITGLSGAKGSSIVDVYTNPSTGKVVLIIIRGTK